MSLNLSYKEYLLTFKFDAKTSRGVLREKKIWLLFLRDSESPDVCGIGEVSPLVFLSDDDVDSYPSLFRSLAEKIQHISSFANSRDAFDWVKNNVHERFPAVKFGMEMAILDHIRGGKGILFSNLFSAGKESIPINGLVWMGDKDFMVAQIDSKLQENYSCIKLKIGALDFETECSLLHYIRNRYSSRSLTIRLDANGAFIPNEAIKKLDILSRYAIHSVEQPLGASLLEELRVLVSQSPIPIALDETLLKKHTFAAKEEVVSFVKPDYIVLKPTLLGGFSSCEEWIRIAEKYQRGWWVTSSLESNIGLNAIAQFVASYPIDKTQGLGTGKLFVNNFEAQLLVENGFIRKDFSKQWAGSSFC